MVLSIVHVLSSYGVGGQERVALDLAIGQRARGHRVAVISLAPPPDGAMADEFREHGSTVDRVAKRGGLDPTLVPRLVLALRRHRADVVHTHNPLPLIYGAPAARLVGAVAIHTKHGKNPGSRGLVALRRAAARLVHAFVAVSETTAEQARAQRDAPLAKLHVIPNGIRLDRYAPDPAARAAARAELGLGDAYVIGTIGRIDDNKNQAMLVRALAPRLGRDVRLVILGDGPADGRAEARPRVRRVRAVVDDRGLAARRPGGDGGRLADRDDRGRRLAGRRRRRRAGPARARRRGRVRGRARQADRRSRARAAPRHPRPRGRALPLLERPDGQRVPRALHR